MKSIVIQVGQSDPLAFNHWGIFEFAIIFCYFDLTIELFNGLTYLKLFQNMQKCTYIFSLLFAKIILIVTLILVLVLYYF